MTAFRDLKLISRIQNDDRSCGDCTACCKTLAVRDLMPPKPRQQKCSHVTADGCAIYDNRPFTCRDFVCAWRASLPGFTKDMRPDRLGIVVWPSPTSDGISYTVDECRPGGMHNKKALALLDRLSRERCIIVDTRYTKVPVVVLHGSIVGKAQSVDDKIVRRAAGLKILQDTMEDARACATQHDKPERLELEAGEQPKELPASTQAAVDSSRATSVRARSNRNQR